MDSFPLPVACLLIVITINTSIPGSLVPSRVRRQRIENEHFRFSFDKCLVDALAFLRDCICIVCRVIGQMDAAGAPAPREKCEKHPKEKDEMRVHLDAEMLIHETFDVGINLAERNHIDH